LKQFMPKEKIDTKKSRSLLTAFRISFVAFSLLPLLVYLYFSMNYKDSETIILPHTQLVAITLILGFTWIALFLALSRMLSKVSILNTNLKKILLDKIDAKTVVDLTREDGEVAELAKSFEELMSKLEDNITELKDTKKSLQQILIKVGKALASAENFDLLISLILETAVDSLRAERAAIIALEDGKYVVKSAFGFDYVDQQKIINVLKPFLDNSFLLKNELPSPLLKMPLVYRDKTWGVIFVSGRKKAEIFNDDDIKIVSSLGSQIAIAFENSALNKNMERTYLETMAALALAVEAKDTYSYGHSQRVGEYAVKVAQAMGLKEEEIIILKDAARLHDIGKIGIADVVLNKPGALSNDEREVIRKHTLIGESIVKPLKTFSHLLEPIRHHHEFLDGTGYPDGLKASEIPLLTRILTVADIFDAISGKRVYRGAMTIDNCKKTLCDMATAGKIDKEVVSFLLGLIDSGDIVVSPQV